jgi:hypothetical protein
VVATLSGKTTAVIEKAATRAAVDPRDSVILNKNDNPINVSCVLIISNNL